MLLIEKRECEVLSQTRPLPQIIIQVEKRLAKTIVHLNKMVVETITVLEITTQDEITTVLAITTEIIIQTRTIIVIQLVIII